MYSQWLWLIEIIVICFSAKNGNVSIHKSIIMTNTYPPAFTSLAFSPHSCFPEMLIDGKMYRKPRELAVKTAGFLVNFPIIHQPSLGLTAFQSLSQEKPPDSEPLLSPRPGCREPVPAHFMWGCSIPDQPCWLNMAWPWLLRLPSLDPQYSNQTEWFNHWLLDLRPDWVIVQVQIVAWLWLVGS